MEDQTLLAELLRLCLFTVYQTALANVIRHSQARNVSVKFWFDEEKVFLEIQDDGKGFEVPKRLQKLAAQGHYGLAGAADRAEAIGGILEVTSAPGQGTLLRVIAPLRSEEASPTFV
jgi:signal transduction histidine kinase